MQNHHSKIKKVISLNITDEDEEEEQKVNKLQPKSFDIAFQSFAQTPQVEIKKTEIFTLHNMIEQIGLKMRPEDYVFEGNKENLMLSDNVYMFEITWKEQTWSIRKRLANFLVLDKQIRKISDDVGIREKQMYPIPKSEKGTNGKQLHDQFFLYLTICLQHSPLRESEVLQEFLEISDINHDGHQKYKECYLDKKAGGRTQESRCARCGVFWGRWNKRYFCITSDGVSISKGRKESECQIREMIMFDYDFSVDYGILDTGNEKGITLNSSNRKLTLNAPSLFQFFDFLYSLKIAINNSPYLGTHRFASFSPVRNFNRCKWYVDGENYFKDVCKFLNEAEKNIFITDWWLSPQMYLIRPIQKNSQDTSTQEKSTNQTPSFEDRIDFILKKKADEKVQIFIIVYKEPTLALGIDSKYTKSSLQHKNIKVLRHPSTMLPFMWSHHEKLVIIDQKIGFLGGLDICYGRMDNSQHLLFDPSESSQTKEENPKEFWPGIDYCNSRTRDFQNVQLFAKSDLDRSKDPRLPWHDVSMRIIGDGVIDLSRHFIQYWNYALADLDLKKIKQNNENYILRAYSQTSPQQAPPSNDEQKRGFMNKLKGKWKQFKSSILVKSDEDTNNQINNNYENQLLEKLDDTKTENFAFCPSEVFKRQDQHELYFQSLMKNKQEGNATYSLHQINQSPFTKEIKNQTQSSNDFHIQQSKENNQEEQKTAEFQIKGTDDIIFKQFISIKDVPISQENQNNSEKKQNVMFPLEKQQLDITDNPKSIFLNSAFPSSKQNSNSESTQKGEKDFQFLQQSRSLSITGNQKKKKSQEFEQEVYFHLLEQVRKGKEEDVSQGFYNNANNLKLQKSMKSEKKQLKRESSSDNDSLIKQSSNDTQDIILENQNLNKLQQGKAQCQVVRSSSGWSCGVKETECSIHIAYIQMIGQAQHFIYIENQFFISGLAGEPVKNQISQALLSRIKQAQINNQKFKVIIILPLLPAFEGEIDANSSILKIQLHWEYSTISRGGTSLLESLKNEGIDDPSQYIQFYGLRTHGQRPCDNEPVTEMVYVHSKLMIIDDKAVIMGSANINDRSMKGSRDSEIAMIVEDEQILPSVMNGKKYDSGKFAHTLRIALFQEHFGLTREELIDPLDEKLYDKIKSNASRNTLIYRDLFRCYPDDEINSVSEWENFKAKKNIEKYAELKDQIVGFAVNFPTLFLKDDNLKLQMSQKEYYVPDNNFT